MTQTAAEDGGSDPVPFHSGSVVSVRHAFTIVEVVVVVLVLGLLAMIVFPRVLSQIDTAKEEAAKSVVNAVRDHIAYEHARTGAYPLLIDESLLHGRLSNPYDPEHPTPVFVANNAVNLYPTHKTLRPGSSFWYNKANGRFAARVPPQENDAATIALYNRVNDHDITSLSQKN